MATHARRLAALLAGWSDDALAGLFARRGVSPSVPWKDFFDAAEALLESSSIVRVLPSLTRVEAAALSGAVRGDTAGISDAAPALRALALIDESARPYPTVAHVVTAQPEVPAASEVPVDPPAAPDPAAHAAEHAFRHVAAVTDMLLITRESPLTLLQNGRTGANERRRFAEEELIPPGTDLDDVIDLAFGAGLVVFLDRRLRLTTHGEAWLEASTGQRWAGLAEGLRDGLPRGIRSATGGWIPIAAWPAAHPWDPAWGAEYSALLRRMHALGLVAADGSEPAWAAPLRAGGPAEPALLEPLLPTAVDKIFLQNDLTAIAPGPLAATLDARLRAAAIRESAAQASSYRFTAESVSHAFALGETEQTLVDFLGDLSLTGIPQPLHYLIGQAAARHGLVRVAAEGERTVISSDDAHLLDTIDVDQSLRALRLTHDGDALVTRVGAASVYWALVDARYPATLLGPDGTAVVAGRHPAVTPEQSESDAAHAALVGRLRAGHGPDTDAAWLHRALESAVQSRALLVVEVAMPDGSTREFTLEATGLGGGRLRGKDRAADVERTLPVTSIRSVRPQG